jgi:hypothetical protein
MPELDLKTTLKSQATQLQELMSYLEDRRELGAREYLYCQAKLHDIVDQLKRLERSTGASRPTF